MRRVPKVAKNADNLSPIDKLDSDLGVRMKLGLLTGIGLDRLEPYLDTLPVETIARLYDRAFQDDILQYFGLKKS
jgi:hypothetical protein